MGFNLEMFFEEMELILSKPHMEGVSATDAITEALELLVEERKYAQECGQIGG